ncbi:hypothetical protein RJ639_023833 [Escallonia herrerae]|uniref:Sodium/calcium exchanger membrane region domain-containing protein n=1 Tax=Escallonia herrerae TaxID=1293975 RepID=A0AA88V1T1_9ASTE|nr:hypothetical protein RJ639_023833 [Escallonia herrerae]
MSSSSLRKKSDLTLVTKVRNRCLRMLLANLQEVLLGTKLSVLFPAIVLAIAAKCFNFGRVTVVFLSFVLHSRLGKCYCHGSKERFPWIFALSALGLTPLAERISFLTEQISYFTSPTVGGLLNATCGNATELIIVIFALIQHKVDIVKCSLLGSILSELLLVLGCSLLCGGLVNLTNEQNFDKV